MFIKMRESKGFTLVELMIVVAIIGILAAVAVPYYQRYVAKSRLTALVFPAIHAMENTLSTKYAVQGQLPASIATADIASIAGDADVTYLVPADLKWDYVSTQLGRLTVNVDITAGGGKLAAIGSDNEKNHLRAVANASGGKCYWTYEGTLAKEFGF